MKSLMGSRSSRRRFPRSSSSGRTRNAGSTIYSARPGVVIGKKGADIDKLRKQVSPS